MLHPSPRHRAVIPSNTCLAERCAGSVDGPFLKAPNWALLSFLAATSGKRDIDNEVSDDFPRILSAPDSPARKNMRSVTPLI
jgi:hypothetical protein